MPKIFEWPNGFTLSSTPSGLEVSSKTTTYRQFIGGVNNTIHISLILDNLPNFIPVANSGHLYFLPLLSAAAGDEEPPKYFCCPITLDIMSDPVTVPSGHTFEKEAIIAAIKATEKNPITRELLSIDQLKPNYALRDAIEDYHRRQKSPEQTTAQADVLNSMTLFSRVWNGKNEQIPKFTPIREKSEGDSIGAIYEKESSKKGPNKIWLGKTGINRELDSPSNSVTASSFFMRGVNLDCIAEKIGGDVYALLARGNYLVPKLRLANLPIKNRFSENHPLLPYILSQIDPKNERPKPLETVHIMSKWIDDFHPFSDARCKENGKEISFEEFIKKNKRPPEKLLIEGRELPLKGLMNILAVGRLLADTDVIGGQFKNCGFVLSEDKQETICVKIDPGCVFTFTSAANKLLKARENSEFAPPTSKLQDQRDIQYQHGDDDIHWNALTPEQKESYLNTLQTGMTFLKNPPILFFILERGKVFNQEKTNLSQKTLDNIQTTLLRLMEIQEEVYQEELKNVKRMSLVHPHPIEKQKAEPLQPSTSQVDELTLESIHQIITTSPHLSIPEVIQMHPQLQSLSLANSKLSENELHSCILNCPERLEKLNLSNTSLNNKTLDLIGRKFSNLTELNIMDCRKLIGEIDLTLLLKKTCTIYLLGTNLKEEIKEKIYAYCFDNYLKRANQKDPLAYVHLGLCYKYGIGIQKNLEEAARYYKLAADQGIASAQNNLGICYKNGDGVQKDPIEAVRYYKLAADQGYAYAQFNLGYCYKCAWVVQKDLAEAARYFKLAADQGYVLGQANLGLCYEYGEGVQKDLGEAARYFKLAADQGDANAQNNLGDCYENGKGVQKDQGEAARYYKLAADQGIASAQIKLGFCYQNGEGVQKDLGEAARYFKLAANQGNANAQVSLVLAQVTLGFRYKYGIGIQKNLGEAARYFKLAADQGNANAQNDLGSCYKNGWGIQKDLSEAARYFKLAADQGNASAQVSLGYCYKNGEGVQKDLGQAARYYKLAADQGNASAQVSLGYCYKNGDGVQKDLWEAARYYKLAADQGNATAQFNLGICYKNGRGVQKDLGQAARYYKLAADQGNANAQVSLGYCYKNGEGVQKNLGKAARYYKLAADQGNATAQFNLGNCYKYGWGVQKDLGEAARYFKLAADQGIASAQVSLGYCYKNGEGVQKDLGEAARYFKLAADQGNANAQFYLGVCYKNGEGVQKDLGEAARYFKLAADQGNASAQNHLNRLSN